MSLKVSYVSASCNQTPLIADWGRNGLICYGASNAVLIYDLKIGGGKVTETLHGHLKRVNAVAWIKGDSYETELVSVSSDSNVIVWIFKDDKYSPTVLKGHSSNVNSVSAIYKNAQKRHAIVASASDDNTLKIWMRRNEDAEFVLHQDINLGYSICIAVKLSLIPKTEEMIMAAATEKSDFDIYIEKDEKLLLASTLKGHEDWVRGLDFVVNENGDILLASTSQDAYVRIWRFISEANYDETYENKYMDTRHIQTSVGRFVIIVKCVLFGHEGWIYAAHWSSDGSKLMTVSLDKNIIIWEYNTDANIWMESVRLGEVGGNTLGFYGGMFNSDDKSLMVHGYHGAFHIWSLNEETSTWEPQVTVGGHYGEVVDLAWEPFGEYLMTVSYDQTTRIHAPWRKNKDIELTWHEIARPQVHGYDLTCLALLGRYKFASGADEKIIRTFQAPDNFVQNFKRLCCIEGEADYNAPKGASVPSLGLSNKAIYSNDNIEQATAKSKKEPFPEESHFKAVDLTEPPTEETLLQNTLWPEVQKLYGHGYELYSLAASPDGKLLASGCKSSLPEHSSILLWETTTWKIIQRLKSHTLTVAQIAFSPDGNHILSVSRDRRWSLFTKNSDTTEFTLTATTNKATGIHSRIIWCCSWSSNSKYFATGSRDGKVVVWWRNPEKVPDNVLEQCEAASEPLILKNESITALAFAPVLIEESYLLAVGLETGFIYLYKWSAGGFKEAVVLNQRLAHHLTVKRLAFRPLVGRAGEKESVQVNIVQLASCSSDHSVRIYDIDINKL